MALALGLSEETVKCYLAAARRRLDARTTAHAVALAMADGAIDPLELAA